MLRLEAIDDTEQLVTFEASRSAGLAAMLRLEAIDDTEQLVTFEASR
jgi:hypothetical protein